MLHDISSAQTLGIVPPIGYAHGVVDIILHGHPTKRLEVAYRNTLLCIAVILVEHLQHVALMKLNGLFFHLLHTCLTGI